MPPNAQPDDATDAVTADIADAFAAPAVAAPAEGGAPAEAAGAPAAEAAGELLARYVRLSADFENFRKRAAREAADRGRYAPENTARALLPVLDNLRRAIDHAAEESAAELIDGLRHTLRQFEEALASVGVNAIEAEGKPFDPSVHEAVMGEDSDAVEVDTVVEDLQRGYTLHDRVLRPTMVRIAHPTGDR